MSASTVGDYGGSGCSTAVVIGLSKQIAEEANCEKPGSFVSFQPGNGITISSSAVLPFLEENARDDLQKVAVNASLQINSGLRTLAQQYLLVAWFNQHRCGITAAASVGNSNHEGGRAVDVQNYSSRISAMSARGWKHDVPGDPVHFDHTSSPDGRGLDVKAFQTLWNRNHPGDLIAVDGDYGPMTAARLKASPATGFAIGPSCVSSDVAVANIVSVDGPDRVGSGLPAHYNITLANNGTTDWPATTQLTVASGQPSALYDASSWTSSTVIGTLPETVVAGSTTIVGIDVIAPTVTEDTPVDELIALTDGANPVGTFDLALTVAMDNIGGSSDGSDEGDDGYGNAGSGGAQEPNVASGGCSAGGSSSGGVLLVLALVAVRRRRR
ncbi:MAG TPA: M15 family metallopeptidase [Kofleriaceae bacterium]|jgi:uncharacterized protein (TIGR03382 family)|nr:M15 family metallopeptidase [Kofleriaceae bacterium]